MKAASIDIREDTIGKATSLIAVGNVEELTLGTFYWSIHGRQGAYQKAHRASCVLQGINQIQREDA